MNLRNELFDVKDPRPKVKIIDGYEKMSIKTNSGGYTKLAKEYFKAYPIDKKYILRKCNDLVQYERTTARFIRLFSPMPSRTFAVLELHDGKLTIIEFRTYKLWRKKR